MHKLIKAEFYKLRKAIYYKVLLLVSMIYALTNTYFNYTGLRGYDVKSGLEAFFNSFNIWGVCLLLSGIFAGLFFAGDFDNRILYSEIAVGNSRKNVFLAKIIIYWSACIIFILIYQILDVIGITCLHGLGYQITFYEFILLLKLEISYLMIFSAFISVCVLVAICFKSLFAVTTIEIVWIIFGTDVLETLAENSTVIKNVYNNSMFGSIKTLTLPLMEEYTGEYGLKHLKFMSLDRVLTIMKTLHYANDVLTSWIIIIVIIFVSYYIFVNIELK